MVMTRQSLTISNTNKKNRSHLFSGSTTNGKQLSDEGPEGRLSASAEARSVSASLLRTKAMMKIELERLSHVSSKIDRDGHLLRDATEDHRGLGSVVRGARRTLGILKRQDLRETIVLWCAVSFFYVVVLYILCSRIRIPLFYLWADQE